MAEYTPSFINTEEIRPTTELPGRCEAIVENAMMFGQEHGNQKDGNIMKGVMMIKNYIRHHSLSCFH